MIQGIEDRIDDRMGRRDDNVEGICDRMGDRLISSQG